MRLIAGCHWTGEGLWYWFTTQQTNLPFETAWCSIS